MGVRGGSEFAEVEEDLRRPAVGGLRWWGDVDVEMMHGVTMSAGSWVRVGDLHGRVFSVVDGSVDITRYLSGDRTGDLLKASP
jgi:hypothetical protein